MRPLGCFLFTAFDERCGGCRVLAVRKRMQRRMPRYAEWMLRILAAFPLGAYGAGRYP